MSLGPALPLKGNPFPELIIVHSSCRNRVWKPISSGSYYLSPKFSLIYQILMWRADHRMDYEIRLSLSVWSACAVAGPHLLSYPSYLSAPVWAAKQNSSLASSFSQILFVWTAVVMVTVAMPAIKLPANSTPPTSASRFRGRRLMKNSLIGAELEERRCPSPCPPVPLVPYLSGYEAKD